MTFTLAAGWHIYAMAVAFVLVCLFLMLVILIQKPKGGGLSGAFGGASGGSAQAAFGAKTGDVLTWFTVVCFALFLLLAMGLQWAIRPDHERLQQELTAGDAASAAVERATALDLDTPDTPAEAAEVPVTTPDVTAVEAPDGPGDARTPNLRDAMEAGQENVQQLDEPTPLIPESDGPQSTDTTPAE